MHDDGKNGDKTAGDGIYFAQLKLCSADFRNTDYYAKSGESKSRDCRICFYRPFTADELKGFASLQERTAAYSDFNEAKAFISESEEILSYTSDAEIQSISYETVYHIMGCWTAPSLPGTIGNGPYALPDSQEPDWVVAGQAASNLVFEPAHPGEKGCCSLSSL